MSREMRGAVTSATDKPEIVLGELHCALTGRILQPEEAYWAPPLITAQQLISTLVIALVRTPSNVGHILFDDQPNVPYAPEAREKLAARRSAEQLKLLLVLLLVAALIITPIVLLAR